MAVSLRMWRRGIFCIFCRSRRGMGRCGLLLRRSVRAWALRLARGRSDIADLFVGAAACARAGALLRAGAAELLVRLRERRRWQRRLLVRPKLTPGPSAVLGV